MADLATVEDLMAFLQMDELHLDAAVLGLRDASAAIRNYTRQYIEYVEDDEITLDSPGGTRIFLPELPVVEVSEVVEDGVTLTPDDDYKLGQHGILHRIGGRWKTGIQIVTVTYSHGYATIPDDITAIATRAASRAYQAGVKAAENEGVPGIVSKQLGDFSVTFGSEGGGGTGEGVLGASAARLLLMSEKDILDRYRP